MPDLESKIASYGTNEKKNTVKQQADSGKKSKGAQQAAPEQEQGIGGMVKGWFWGKKWKAVIICTLYSDVLLGKLCGCALEWKQLCKTHLG